MIQQRSKSRKDEQNEKAVKRIPRTLCQCCGAPVRRQSLFSQLYALLCRGCWLVETSEGR